MSVPYGMCYPIVQCGVEIPNRVFVGGLPYDVSRHQTACMSSLLHRVPHMALNGCAVHMERERLLMCLHAN